jgi:hypothetical protein
VHAKEYTRPQEIESKLNPKNRDYVRPLPVATPKRSCPWIPTLAMVVEQFILHSPSLFPNNEK